MCKESRLDNLADQILLHFYAPDCKTKSAALCLRPTGNDVCIHGGDTDEERERVKVKVAAGVSHEEKEPGTADFYSDESSRLSSLNEKNKISCAQMSGEADIYGQCADMKQSEKKKVQTETEENGENRVSHPNPTSKMILEENTNTVIPPPQRRRIIAANLGPGSHQKRPAHEINDKPAERTKKANKRLYVKIIEEEIRPLK